MNFGFWSADFGLSFLGLFAGLAAGWFVLGPLLYGGNPVRNLCTLWGRLTLLLYSLCALSLLCGLSLFFAGCESPRPAAGSATWERSEYSVTGDLRTREKLTVQQNEDPAGPTRILFSNPHSKIQNPKLEVRFGSSFIRKIPKSFAHMETILLIAGILCIVAAAAFGALGKHWKLMTISAATGALLIAIAVTIEAYAWAYALGLLASAVALGWYLWSRYKRQILSHF